MNGIPDIAFSFFAGRIQSLIVESLVPKQLRSRICNLKYCFIFNNSNNVGSQIFLSSISISELSFNLRRHFFLRFFLGYFYQVLFGSFGSPRGRKLRNNERFRNAVSGCCQCAILNEVEKDQRCQGRKKQQMPFDKRERLSHLQIQVQHFYEMQGCLSVDNSLLPQTNGF